MANDENQPQGRDMMRDIANQTVKQLVLILNPAPYVREEFQDDYEYHRGNTPWVIGIPALGVAVEAVNRDGEPITGYFPDDEAEEYARELWNRLRDNPEMIDELQNQSEWPEHFLDGSKLMFRYINVQPIQ